MNTRLFGTVLINYTMSFESELLLLWRLLHFITTIAIHQIVFGRLENGIIRTICFMFIEYGELL